MRELMSGAEDVLGREARRRAVFSPESTRLAHISECLGEREKEY